MGTMRAWRTGTSAGELELVEARVPEPRPGEVIVQVIACGICRTDLHVIDQEIPVHRTGVIPGHQAIGRVTRLGPGVEEIGRAHV